MSSGGGWRRLVGALLLGVVGLAGAAEPLGAYPPVQPGYELRFPRDHGAHPAYRIEWWYLTGWLSRNPGGDAGGSTAGRPGAGTPRGFQLTFFRLRPRVQEGIPSAFAAHQLLFAHAALADPAIGRLRQAEKSARAGFGLAMAAEGDTAVAIDDWRLHRDARGYRAVAAGADFAFDLQMSAAEPPLLQGEAGYSRKSASAGSASYYYSRPQLTVRGSLVVAGERQEVSGRAWLDHEWASSLLPAAAVGWDWVGLNLDDGGALMAFRLRDREGAPVWAAATRWRPGASPRHLAPGDVQFAPQRHWRSPRSGITYPVVQALRVGEEQFVLEPLLDDQELDARRSVGALYWEGAVRALRNGAAIGLGYLELTGYGARLRY